MLKLVACPGSNQGRLSHSQEKTPRLDTSYYLPLLASIIIFSSVSYVYYLPLSVYWYTLHHCQNIYWNTLFLLKLKMSL